MSDRIRTSILCLLAFIMLIQIAEPVLGSGSVSGTCLEGANKVPNAEVTCRAYSSQGQLLSVQSDDSNIDGTYSVGYTGTASYWILRAREGQELRGSKTTVHETGNTIHMVDVTQPSPIFERLPENRL